MGYFSLVFLLPLAAAEVWTLQKIDLAKFPDALCLDGSPAAFWYTKGYGSGVDKFVIHHQGGGWCINEEDCYSRSLSDIGSSTNWEESPDCSTSTAQPCQYDGDQGLFGLDASKNPLIYNWNRLYIGYCDGASYAGQVKDPVTVNNATIHFKGRFLLDAIYDTFLTGELAMNKASEVILSGTSAGGLAIYLHADYLRQKIVVASHALMSPRVVAVPDAGYFMDLPGYSGEYLYTPNYKYVFNMQHVENSVNHDCIAHHTTLNESWKCFMAPYTLPFIKTELFIANSFVDSWQGVYIMGLGCDPRTNCNVDQISYLNAFRSSMLDSLQTFLAKKNAGAWLCECWQHPLLDWDTYWLNVPVQNQSLSSTFVSWYNRDQSNKWVAIDGVWGSNSAC